MKKIKKTNKQKLLRVLSRLTLIIFLLFLNILLIPQTASAQIITLDPVTAGIQSIIQEITAANTAIQAAESKIQVELSALKYVRQGQQLMNQIQNLQQESSSLIGAVNNIESTVMMPADELEGLKNSLMAEQASMSNIINMENGNPLMQGFMQNYQNVYGQNQLFNANTNQSYYGNVAGQYNKANTQAMQTAGYAQGILNNSTQQQNLISQLGSNVAAAHGSVAAQQATGQAVVALTEEVNQTNKLLAEQAKLAAVQAGTKDSQSAASATALSTTVPVQPTQMPASDYPTFGSYPNVTNFGIGK
jgi:conjugal transfer/entry exclusion protein